MRATPSVLTLALLLAGATPALADFTLPRVSPNAGVSQTIGTTDLSIKYCRPGVKGRPIWGALVPYDKPWRTGANEITAFTTSDDIRIEGQTLPAGTYGVVTIPGRDQWTVAFSKQKDMWGAFTYDPKQDQLRVTAKPEAADMMEWMQFSFDSPSPDGVVLALRWEKLRVPIHIDVDVTGKVMKEARTAVAAAKSDDWRTLQRAAGFALDAGQPEAADWAARALKAKENFATLSLSARVAAKAGRRQEAVAQMRKAIDMGKADKTVEAEQLAPMEKMLADWTAKP